MKKSIKILITTFLVLALLVVIFYRFYNNSDNSSFVVAKVNDQKIYTSDILAVQQNALNEGYNVTKEKALEQIVNKELIFQAAKKEGYFPTDEEAEGQVILQLEDKNMSLEDYKKSIESSGLSYEKELGAIKGEIAIANYLKANINVSAINVTDAEALEFYKTYEKQVPGQIESFEKSKEQIIQTLTLKKQREAIDVLVNKLRINAQIEYY